MTNARINGLRSIELGVHDLQKSAEFYRRVWALEDVAAEGDTIHLRGTGREHHVVTLHERPRVEPSFVPDVIDEMLQVPDAGSLAAIRLLRERTGHWAGGSTGPKRQFIAKSYSKRDLTATTFAFLPGAVAGCFHNREGANSPPTRRQEPV